MADPRDPSMRRQRHFLESVRRRALFTDDSLTLEAGLDRTAMSNYRAGRRTAPLALLFAMLDHAGEDAIEVLQLLAAEHGLRVVRDLEAAGDAPRDLREEAMDVVEAAGRSLSTIRSAIADDVITPDELEAIRADLDHLTQEVAELIQAARRPVRAVR